NGVAQAGVPVTFNVTPGPDLGQNATNNTVANGQATYTYSNNGTPGTDTIRATSLGATGMATKVWIAPDSVGDGIPDLWCAQYFGGNGTSTNSQSCAACDADATGQNNLFKYVTGLNTTNSASVFVFSVENVNGRSSHLDRAVTLPPRDPPRPACPGGRPRPTDPERFDARARRTAAEAAALPTRMNGNCRNRFSGSVGTLVQPWAGQGQKARGQFT